MKAIHELVAYFFGRGWLTKEQRDLLLRKGLWQLSDPGNLEEYCDRVGQTFFFQTTGKTSGPLWGSGPYTSDSNLGTAAVHAGLLAVGQSGVLKVTMVPPIPYYGGSVRHGVSSSDWSTGWHGAYEVEKVM